MQTAGTIVAVNGGGNTPNGTTSQLPPGSQILPSQTKVIVVP